MLMNEMQKEAILVVFDCLEEIHGRTFIQKLFYVLKKQVGEMDIFSYEPYKYGPFSRELNRAINGLLEEELIIERKRRDYFSYEITKKGRQVVKKQNSINPKTKSTVEQVCKTVKRYTPSQLLEYVYNKYPDSAVNSLLKK